MYLSAIAIILCLLSSEITLEAAGGLTMPGSPESDNPALDMDFRLMAGIAPSWDVFLSASFWRIENFHPTGDIPEFTHINPGIDYEMFGEFSDSHRGFQIGISRKSGPVSLELAGGTYSRTVMTYLPGTGKRYGEDNYDDNGFISSIAVALPAGNSGVLRVGTRTEDFENWFLTVSTGLSFTVLSSQGGAE